MWVTANCFSSSSVDEFIGVPDIYIIEDAPGTPVDPYCSGTMAATAIYELDAVCVS